MSALSSAQSTRGLAESGAALAGAGIGAAAGGLLGALTGMGIPEEEAHVYAEGVRRGGTLVTVTRPVAGFPGGYSVGLVMAG